MAAVALSSFVRLPPALGCTDRKRFSIVGYLKYHGVIGAM